AEIRPLHRLERHHDVANDRAADRAAEARPAEGMVEMAHHAREGEAAAARLQRLFPAREPARVVAAALLGVGGAGLAEGTAPDRLHAVLRRSLADRRHP